MLPGVPRRSPFTGWRPFCRAMVCFGAGDDDGLRQLLGRLPEDFVLAGTVADCPSDPAPSRRHGPQAPSSNRRAIGPSLPGMILTATSRIEGMAYPAAPRHGDRRDYRRRELLEERHQAPRRSTRRSHRAGRPPPNAAARGCPHRTERLSGARRHANGWPQSRSAHSRAPTMPVSAHTAARIHQRCGPTRRPHAPSNSPGSPSRTLLGRRYRAARRSGPSPPSRTLFLNAPSAAPFFETVARTTDRAARTQPPIFKSAPSTATSRAVSTHRGCPRTPAHRAVLAPGTAYSPHAPSRPRPPSATPPGMILTTTSRIEEQAHTAVPPRHRDR